MGQQKIESGQDVTHLMQLKSGDDVTDLMNAAPEEPPNRTDLILANPLETPRDIPPIKSEIKPNSMFQNIMDWGNRSIFTGEDAPTPMDYFNNPRRSWERGLDTALTSPFAIGGELLGGIGLLKGISKFRNAGKVAGTVAEEVPKKVPDILGETPINPANIEKPLEAGPAVIPQFKNIRKGKGKGRFKKEDLPMNIPTEEAVAEFLGVKKPVPAPVRGRPKKIIPEAGIKLEDAQAGLIPRLPRELQGAKPRYNLGANSYIPEFENDIDKSLFIIAQETKSKQDEAYLKFVMDNLGLDESAARAEGLRVRGLIKEGLKGQEPGSVKLGRLHNSNLGGNTPNNPVIPPNNPVNNVPPNNVPPSGGGNIPPEIPPIPNIHDEFMGRLENEGLLLKAASLMKGSKATGDLGPMFRQGIAYTGRPAWNKALVQQFKSFFSEGAHEAFRQKLQTHPLMVKDAKGISEADRMELYIPELGTLTKEEAQAGLDLTEKVWGKAKLGFIPRSSNRAFADSIASLRINVAQSLKERYGALYESMLKEAQLNPGKANEILKDAEQFNPKNNLVLERIGEEVNSASGRGSLKIKGRSVFGQKLYGDINMGKYADAANVTLFSPRLIQSRLNTINRTLNPFSYLKQDPVMRKEHLKQLLSITGAITASDTLYSMFGGETGKESTSSDFGKSRFGNITIDPTGGLGKYGTLEERLRRQELTSAQSKRVFKLGQNPVVGDSTTLLGNFAKGTISPAASLALEIISTGGRSFTGRDAIGQPAKFNSPNPFENPMVRDTVIPMIYQDIYEIIQEDPSYLPLIFPDAMGQGVNVFNKDKK